MITPVHVLLIGLGVCFGLSPGVSRAQDTEAQAASASTITAYPASFFSSRRTYSAFDMLALVPGYEFADSDTDVRGFAGAAGNVLIDGSRPASKYESLENILRRIPASAVERIEVIRAGTPGIDMQGYPMLANVVRAHGVQTRGSVEIGDAFYERGLNAPRIAAEMARASDERVSELSGALYRTVDDEHGDGSRPRVSANGEVLRDGTYVQDEGEKVAQLATGYETDAFDGKLRLHGSLQRTRFRADILDAVTFPAPVTTTGVELEDELSSEIGARFERALSRVTQLEVLAIRRDLQADESERAQAPDEYSSFSEESDASESILRTLVRRQDGMLTLEGGVEIALNVLDSSSSLVENDIPVAIPSAKVRVQERRGEAFLTATWTLSAQWHVELGARCEYSELSQSGDNASQKTFFFPKPRALVSWFEGSNQVRFLIEREVGQLDFEDFASSASLSTGTVTAGNPDLEPDQTWRTEIAWERRVLDGGAITVTARHEEIDDLVDRIPVFGDEVFDAIGNIGEGERNELELGFTLPLDSIGLSAGLMKAAVLWRDSEATDPVTGESRTISEDVPREASLHVSQAIPRWRARWGLDVAFATLEHEYHFDEVRTDSLENSFGVFVEYEPVPSWNVRLFASNLTDRPAIRRREVYDGMRSEAPLDYVETRTLKIGPYAGIEVRRQFGE